MPFPNAEGIHAKTEVSENGTTISTPQGSVASLEEFR